MENQIGALAELLKQMQSRMDQQHDFLMKNLSAMQDLRGKSPATSAATISILTADTEERKASASTISTKPATPSSTPSPPSPTAATASILAASSDERETEFANSTTSATAPSAAQDISLAIPSANPNNQECEVDISTSSKLATPPPVFSTPSPTSAPTQDAALGFEFGVPKLFIASCEIAAVTHGNCATLGDGPLATPATQSPSPDSSQEAVLAPMEHSLVTPAKCSVLCLYQSVGNKLHITSEISASSKDLVSWCPASSTSDAYKVFKVMPVFLFLPPSSCCSVWNLHSVYNRDDNCLKSPWPPPTQDECKGGDIYHGLVHWLTLACNGVGLLVQQPWPPPVSDMITSSQEEMQPRIWLVKSNRTTVPVQLEVLLCWSFLIGCFCTGQWRFHRVMVSDDVGSFIILRNYSVHTQLLACLFIVCTRAETRQSKMLLLLMSGICYVELPTVHSNFHSYILVSEVISGKPKALHFVCRNGGNLLQPWSPPDPFLALGDQFSLCGNHLVVECGDIQPKPPWFLCTTVSGWFGKMQLVSGFLLEVSPWYLSAIYLSVRSAAQQRVQCNGAWLEMGKTCIRSTLVTSTHVETVATFRRCHSEWISLIQSNCWREVQWDHCQLFVEGNITDGHFVYLMHGWKPPWRSYVCRNISSHHPAISFVMVILGINIAETNWECMVYLSGAVTLDFFRPVVLFQSCHDAILFDSEACCKLSCGWIISPKLFYSTAVQERNGLNFQENFQAWHFTEINQYIPQLAFDSWILENCSSGVGLDVSWYNQCSLYFHLMADTRRTMRHFNQDSCYSIMERCVLGCGISKFLDRRNVQVQQQWKFSDDPLTSNLESQQVILWAGGDLCATVMYEYISVETVSFCGCYSTDTSNIIVEFVACDILQTTNMLQSHLLDMFRAFSHPPNTSNVRPQQGSKLSKPPWLLCFGKMEVIGDQTIVTSKLNFHCKEVNLKSCAVTVQWKNTMRYELCVEYSGYCFSTSQGQQRLGGKPCFKEGRMSGYCSLGQEKDKWAGLILYRPMAARHERG